MAKLLEKFQKKVNIIEKIKANKNNLILFVLLFLFTLLLFSQFLKGHYSTDTYNIINRGYEDYAINYSILDGRPIMSLIGLFFNFLNISIEMYVFITLFVAIIISCACVVVLKNIIERIKKPSNKISRIMVILISYITMFNFMYLENMYFVECIVMALSILLYLKAVDIIVNRPKEDFYKAIILSVIAFSAYQGTLGLFISFFVLMTFIKNKLDFKLIFKDIVKISICFVIAFGVNLLIINAAKNILGNSNKRISSFIDIFENLKVIKKHIYVSLFNTANLFPQNYFFIFLLIIFAIVLDKCKKNKKEVIIISFVLIVISFLSSTIVSIITSSGFAGGRLQFSVGALIGFLAIIIYVFTDILDEKSYYKYLFIIILISYFLLTMYSYIYIMNAHIEVNKAEQKEVLQIEEFIKDYEKENNIVVSEVFLIFSDEKENTFVENINNYSILTYNAIYIPWSSVGVINYYTGRDFKWKESLTEIDVIKDEKIIEKLKKNKYTCLNNRLLILL